MWHAAWMQTGETSCAQPPFPLPNTWRNVSALRPMLRQGLCRHDPTTSGCMQMHRHLHPFRKRCTGNLPQKVEHATQTKEDADTQDEWSWMVIGGRWTNVSGSVDCGVCVCACGKCVCGCVWVWQVRQHHRNIRRINILLRRTALSTALCLPTPRRSKTARASGVSRT